MKRIVRAILAVLAALLLTACGSPAAPSGPAAEYAVGDILLADGSVVKAAAISSVDRGNPPVAVIAGIKADGAAFGVGLHRSGEPLPWATDTAEGYAAQITGTVCTQASKTSFAGDVDGSDNWDAVCAQQSAADTMDSAKNYPAFHFVNTYAETYKLTGDYASGWYMPSIAELYEIYQNREAVNAALQAIYGLDHEAAMNGLETNWYWSSSQAASEDDYAWFVHYFNGYAGECPKNFTNVHVLAVRAF